MRVYLGLALAVILGFAGWRQAAPVDVKAISADMKWAAHLDVDALMASTLQQKVRAQIIKEHPEIENALAMVRNLLRFDPTTDLHGITVYGTQLKKDTGVAIIRAKVDQKLVLDIVKSNPDHKVSTYGKYELHTWRKDAHKLDNATFYAPDVIVFGNSLDELKAALDVLDGSKPSLTAKAEELTALLPPGTIFAAGAKDLSTADLPHESSLVKQADSFLLIVGENQGQVSVHAVLTVKDAEIAKQIKAVADGALALAALVKCDDPDALKLIGGVKVTLVDKTVSVEGQAAVDLLWTHIQKEIDKNKAEHHHHATSGK